MKMAKWNETGILLASLSMDGAINVFDVRTNGKPIFSEVHKGKKVQLQHPRHSNY